jgi:putative YphP/YqiW family bacilliredoxin
MYPPDLVQPMREEVTRHGVKELRSAADVDQAIQQGKGTALVFINSVCGCAGGIARPGFALALKHKVLPSAVYTVFAGQDQEATARVRELIKDYPPSSPSIALFKDGKIVHMIQRHDIEGRDPKTVAAALTGAFDKHCK